jgi:hypothetical protein
VAAHFALDSAMRNNQDQKKKPEAERRYSNSIIVWALNTGGLEALRAVQNGEGSEPYRPFAGSVLTVPRHKNAFLAAQRGLFTHIKVPREFYFSGEWPALEDILAKYEGLVLDSPAAVLRGHVLHRDQFFRLQELLDREGINKAGLMPTLDNVAKVVVDRSTR